MYRTKKFQIFGQPLISDGQMILSVILIFSNISTLSFFILYTDHRYKKGVSIRNQENPDFFKKFRLRTYPATQDGTTFYTNKISILKSEEKSVEPIFWHDCCVRDTDEHRQTRIFSRSKIFHPACETTGIWFGKDMKFLLNQIHAV